MASQSNDQELREIFGLAPGQGDNGILEFGATEYSQTENGLLVAAVKVLRRGPLTGSPSATIALRDGTAVAGSDYLKEPISVQFLPGEVEKTITIPLVDDAVIEDVESLTLTLQNPKNGAGIGPQATATLKVLDNDGAAIIESRPSVAGSPLPIDSVDVFLPPGGEVLLEVTVTVPAEGGEPVTSVRPLSREPRAAQTVSLPLDVFLLQDLSGSFEDDIDVLQGDPASGRAGLAENLVTQLQSLRPDTTFGLGSFVDKPIRPFGDAVNGDYNYRLEQPQSLDGKLFQQTVQGLSTRDGGDTPESQLEALLLLARRTGTAGFRPNARRVVVVSTDARYHQAGDFPEAFPNNGDGLSGGIPQGISEDYPSVQQVKNALIEADLLPIFAVTGDQLATYRDLVDDSDGDGFGFGSVVQLERDSSNLTNAITEGLGNVGREINIFAISDEAKRVKEILPAKFTGVQAGETKKFVVRLQSDGLGSSDDSLILRALGYGDIKVNLLSQKPVTQKLTFEGKEQSLGLSVPFLGTPLPDSRAGFSALYNKPETIFDFKTPDIKAPDGSTLIGGVGLLKGQIQPEFGYSAFFDTGSFDIKFPVNISLSGDGFASKGSSEKLKVKIDLADSGGIGPLDPDFLSMKFGAEFKVVSKLGFSFETDAIPGGTRKVEFSIGDEFKNEDLLKYLSALIGLFPPARPFVAAFDKIIEVVDLDLALNGNSSKIESIDKKQEDLSSKYSVGVPYMSADDTMGFSFDISKLVKIDSGSAKLKAEAGAKGTVTAVVKALEFDFDNLDDGKNEFLVSLDKVGLLSDLEIPVPDVDPLTGMALKSGQTFSPQLFVRPVIDVLTSFDPQAKLAADFDVFDALIEYGGEAGKSVVNALAPLIDKLPEDALKASISYTTPPVDLSFLNYKRENITLPSLALSATPQFTII